MARRRDQGFEKALRRRYGAEIADIRAQYEAAADDLDEQIRDLVRQRRSLESDYQILARKYRRDVAKLKRLDLIPKTVDVRRLTKAPPSIGRALNKFHDVLTGRAKAKKVTRKVARQLREEGFTAQGRRVVIGPEVSIGRTSGVVEQRTRGGKRRLRSISMKRSRAEVEAWAADIFDDLVPPQYVAIEVYGNFSELFGPLDRERFLNKVMEYRSREQHKPLRIGIVDFSHDEARNFILEQAEEKAAHSRDLRQARRKRARVRARERKRGGGGRSHKG